jgi:hypothetical protein
MESCTDKNPDTNKTVAAADQEAQPVRWMRRLPAASRSSASASASARLADASAVGQG